MRRRDNCMELLEAAQRAREEGKERFRFGNIGYNTRDYPPPTGY